MQQESYRNRQTSIWESRHYPTFFDVGIVGGGLVGLQTALYLTDRSPSLKVAIFERDDPPAGASTRNAGFACVGSLGELVDDVAQIGLSATLNLVARRYQGLQLLRKRVGDEQLAYEALPNIEWFRAGDEVRLGKSSALLETVNQGLRELLEFDQPIFSERPNFTRETGLSALAAIENKLEGQLDPGAMIRALQKQCSLREVYCFRESVKDIQGQGNYQVQLASGKTVQCRQTVLSTNAFTADLLPSAIQPALNQVIVSEPVPELQWTQPMHLNAGYGYIRRIGDRVLVGGFRDRVGASAKTAHFQLDPRLSVYLREILVECLPKSWPAKQVPRIEYEWSGVLGLGPTRNPQVSEGRNGLIIAAGMGGMGVALGSLIAKEAAEIVHERV